MSKDQEGQNNQDLRTSVLEYFIAGLGLMLVLAALGFMGYRALADANRPPEISLEVLRVTRSSGGYLVLLEARNSSDETAAELTVEGTVERPGQEPETSEITFDFVPPDSVREGGLFFQADPEGALTLKLLGYRDP